MIYFSLTLFIITENYVAFVNFLIYRIKKYPRYHITYVITSTFSQVTLSSNHYFYNFYYLFFIFSFLSLK